VPSLGRGHRRAWLIAAAVVVCAGGAAGLLWGKSWLFPGPLARAETAYARGKFAEAERLARRRVKEAPHDEDALRLAARATARLDRDQAAVSSYARVELVRMTAEDYFLLGRALSRIGQDESALKSFEAAKQADPESPEILNALAETYFRMDLDAPAETTAERLTQKPGWQARAQLMLGMFRWERHDPAGAARALQRAFELDPAGKAAAPAAVGPFQKVLVRALLQTREPRLARQYLEQFGLSGSDSEAAWLLSRCFLQEKNWERAAALLGEAREYREQYPFDPEPAFYVGAVRCGSCHRQTYASVLASRHATTFARAGDLKGVPLPDGPLADPGDPAVTHTMQPHKRGMRVQTRAGGEVMEAVARYAFGAPDHYVTFTGRDDKGQMRELRLSHYVSPRGSGWDLSTGSLKKPQSRADYVGQAMAEQDGERRCLSCHTTNFRSVQDQSGPEAADHSIGCEGCHGPGGHHVLAVEAQFPDMALVSPKPEAGAAINEICGRCHGLDQPKGFSGDPDDPGWFRFELVRLQKSRCYTGSGAQLNCVTCHDPHKNAQTSAAANEAKCLSCHGNNELATRICPVDASQGCVKCHMTRVWHEPTHAYKSDHYIRVLNRTTATTLAR
jgi:tetratricopeptide (TPR) repeat protein